MALINSGYIMDHINMYKYKYVYLYLKYLLNGSSQKV